VFDTEIYQAHIYIKWLRELEQAVAAEKNWLSTPNIMGLINILNYNLYESTANRDTYMSILNQVPLGSTGQVARTNIYDYLI